MMELPKGSSVKNQENLESKHHSKQFNSPVLVEKDSIDCYFEGTKPKKEVKKKIRKNKCVPFREFFPPEPVRKEVATPPPPPPQLDKLQLKIFNSENQILKKIIRLKIFYYQEQKKQEERQCYIAQRQKEKKAMEEIENLAETWFKKCQNKRSSSDFTCNSKSYSNNNNNGQWRGAHQILAKTRIFRRKVSTTSNNCPTSDERSSSEVEDTLEDIEKRLTEKLVEVEEDEGK